MAYKPQSDEEKEILEAYDGVKDAIIQGMMTQGMEEIKTVGETFDFKLHDCMFTEQSMEYEEDIVTRVRCACVAMVCGRMGQTRRANAHANFDVHAHATTTPTGVQQGLHDRRQGHPARKGGLLDRPRPLNAQAASQAHVPHIMHYALRWTPAARESACLVLE